MVVRCHDIPSKTLSDSLSAVSKCDSFPTVKFAEPEQVGGELFNATLRRDLGSIEDEHSVLERIGHVAFDICPKTAQIRRHCRQSKRQTLKRGVAPRFIVTWEYPHVTATHELIVVETKEACERNEVWVKDYLNRVIRAV
jgi:hypothetical protein